MLASAASSRALEVSTAPKANQLEPPSVVYSQVPLVSSTAMTAMPSRAPVSASVTCPEMRSETSVPGLLTGSSEMAVRSLAPLSTGASFAAAGLIGTAAIAHCLSTSSVQDMSTDAAPGSVLLPPRKLLKPLFHCCVWPAPTVIDDASRTAMVSNTHSPALELTVALAVIVLPVLETKLPSGVVWSTPV